MTQKELLYFEDAIKHEENIMKIIDLSLSSLTDKELIDFMNKEKKIHKKMMNDLINLLEVKSNG